MENPYIDEAPESASAEDPKPIYSLDAYLKEHSSLWSKPTLKTATSHLKALADHGWPLKSPGDLSQLLLLKYKKYTVKQMLIRAAHAERWLLNTTRYADWISKSPALFRGVYKGRSHFITHEQITKILNKAKSYMPEIYNYLWLMARAGLRRNEAANVKWDDLDPEGQGIYVESAKGSRVRTIPVPKLWFTELLTNDYPLVRGPFKYPDRQFVALSKLIRIPFTPHDLRAAALQHYSQILSPRELQNFAGHANFNTTCKYLVADKNTMIAKLDKKS